jgi:Asp-tRNA(Asn)/Glu-tRNA(Gln) amidotransferase A subunit family amidase
LGNSTRFLGEFPNEQIPSPFYQRGAFHFEVSEFDVSTLYQVAKVSIVTFLTLNTAKEIPPFSLTGHPVVVIPIGQTQTGLPIGMQIAGKRWKEMELLAIAEQLTQITRDFQHPPGY